MNLNEQLRALAIGHYVVGGLHALFACFGLIHFAVGMSFILQPEAWNSADGAPPSWFGLMFAGLGGAFVLFGWTLGALTMLSGRFIQRRRHRMFSIIMGGVNCAMLPLGTVLGVFDLVLLTKEETRRLYGEPDTGGSS